MIPQERFRRLLGWLIDDIQAGRAQQAYWLTRAIVRLVTEL